MLLPLHLNLWAKVPGGGSLKARHFQWDEELTLCPPKAKKHCKKAKDEFKLIKLHSERIDELSELIAELRNIPRLLPRRQFIRRVSKRQKIEKELVKEIRLKKKSEEILEQEEEAIIALMFNERYNF